MQGFRQVLKQVHQHFDGRDVALLPSILLLVGSKFVLSPLQLRVHWIVPRAAAHACALAMPPIISCGEEPSSGAGNGDGSSLRIRQKEGTDGASNQLRDY